MSSLSKQAEEIEASGERQRMARTEGAFHLHEKRLAERDCCSRVVGGPGTSEVAHRVDHVGMRRSQDGAAQLDDLLVQLDRPGGVTAGQDEVRQLTQRE